MVRTPMRARFQYPLACGLRESPAMAVQDLAHRATGDAGEPRHICARRVVSRSRHTFLHIHLHGVTISAIDARYLDVLYYRLRALPTADRARARMHEPASSGPHPDESAGALSIGGVMTTFSPRRTRQKRGARCQLRRPSTHFDLVAALTLALVAGATAPAAAAPRTPRCAYSTRLRRRLPRRRLRSEPAEEVNLAGTWDFTPLTNTICTGGGRFGTTTGPFLSCVDAPAGGGPTTIQVPGGGWVKQGWTDLSRATYARRSASPSSRRTR